ncbi:hypothetical protein, partial [Pseudoflavonifractor sp. MSJ-37]|uniref:hypothetical protein n=1 Tax=Pseudoflavonifractor sp. MSJ-37 TaxID=2841531 RepID=UPI001C1130C5
ADTVTYSWTYNANGTSVAVQNKTGKTMLEDKFNAIKVEGVVVANEFANLNSSDAKGSSMDDGKTRVEVTNYGSDEDQNVFKTGTYSVTTGQDELGKSITLYVKNDSGNTSKATVLGSAVLSEDNKIAVSAGNKDVTKLADDNDLDIVSSTKVVSNYANATEWGKLDDATRKSIGALKDDTHVNRGVEKVLIDNDDDGDVDYILLTKLAFGKVTSYSTKSDGSITVNAGSAVTGLTADDKKDVVGFDDVKKDDYVLAAWIGGDLHVQKAESVTGKLEALKEKETMTVAGTSYDVSAVLGYTGGDDDIYSASTVTKNFVDSEGTFYLDLNGMVIAVGEATENGGKYAYVWAGDNDTTGIDSDRVKVTLEDGTTKVYTLDSGTADTVKTAVKALKTSTADTALGRVYAYSIGSDGEIKLTAPKDNLSVTGDASEFTKNKTQVGGLTVTDSAKQTKYASSSTVFFYVTIKGGKIDDVDVYTGYTNAPSVSSVKAYAAYNAGGNMAAVAFTGGSIVGKDVADFVYVTDIGTSTNDYTNAKAILPGSSEETDIKIDGSWDKNGAYLYTITKDNTYKLTDPASGSYESKSGSPALVVNNISSKTVATNTAEYKLTDKTVWVEQKDNGDFDTASVGTLPNNSDKGLVTYLLHNSDSELLLVVTKAAKSGSTTPSTPTTTDVITKVDLTIPSKVTVTCKKGTDVATLDMVNEVIPAVQKELTKKGYTVKSITLNDAGDTYTFEVVNGLITANYKLATTDVKAEV